MYGRNTQQAPSSNTQDKNPNRVSGGLKGQGVDHIVMVRKKILLKTIQV